MNCLIVDDDEFSRLVIRKFVERTQNLQCIGECENAIDAFQVLKSQEIDILFLDIEMPDMSGLELVKSLKHTPQIILITTRPQYAVEAFDLNVTDFIVKPVQYQRFLKAVDKALSQIKAVEHETQNTDYQDLFIKTEGKIIKLDLQQVFYIEANADYVIFVTDKENYSVHGTMKSLENNLPKKDFIRIHRSYIIHRKYIESIDDNHVVIHNVTLPIGNSYKNDFLQQLKFLI